MFLCLILAMRIRAGFPVKAPHESPSPPFLLRCGFGRINFLQNQSQLPATQFPVRSRFERWWFGFGFRNRHSSKLMKSWLLSTLPCLLGLEIQKTFLWDAWDTFGDSTSCKSGVILFG